MSSDDILQLVYEIQGAADSSHPADTLAERMQTIYEDACYIMQRTGFEPR